MNAAMQNAKVWARRMNVQFDSVKFEEALVSSGFGGSVLKGPLTLLFFKKISGVEWAAKLPRDDRRNVSAMLGASLAGVVRGDEQSLLAALANSAETSRKKTLFASYNKEMSSLLAEAIAARTAEKSRPGIVDAVLRKQRY